MTEHAVISQLVASSAQNGSHIAKLPRPVKEIAEVERTSTLEFINFNISGTKFTVTQRLLTKYPLSRLCSSDDLEDHWLSEESAYYFDRDPSLFNAVLNVFRYNVISIPAGYSEIMFKNELKFWKISWDELEVGCNLDLDEEIEKEFKWMENRIPPPPPTTSRRVRQKYLVWCFLTDPMGPHTMYRKASLAYSVINIFLTVFFLTMFGLSTKPEFRVVFDNVTNETVTATCGDEKLYCYLESAPIFWLDNILYALLGYFLLETFLRIVVCPDYKIYLKSVLSWADIVAAACLIFEFSLYLLPDDVWYSFNHKVLAIFSLAFYGCQVLRVFKMFQVTETSFSSLTNIRLVQIDSMN